LTQNSLAAIPDDTEAYAFNTVLTNNNNNSENMPFTPGKFGMSVSSHDIAVGDTVDVPGDMSGTVRFVGPVAGRKGVFAGVELHREFAARGKNSGDVDGISYFTTSTPGAGIFLPLAKAIKRESPPSSFPLTPTGGLKAANQNSVNYTPPTPSLPKFSQSVGPGRAASPMGKKPPRASLQRPESPVRRVVQATPGPRPSITTPGPKPPARFGSPTSNKFAQSARGAPGDPAKRAPSHARKPSVGPRSASALGNPQVPSFADDETTTLGYSRVQQNGNSGQPPYGLKMRPSSRATSRAASRIDNHVNDDELERLRAQLRDREMQLKEQASTLTEMESSLTELQGIIENSDGPPHQQMRRNSMEDKDASQLRSLLREKNEKIALLTAEFDAHRADFRSTIDTLEMASTETERVYEKRIEELMQEIQELQDRTADVDTVATQLKQLEELVQELEEGLEDARRGEAEARGEVEFLRGEVERTRSELRREREKAQAVMNGSNGGFNGGATSKELEQKEDEIRGLKAIIHSLSRDSVPNDNAERTPTQRSGSFRSQKGESIEDRLSREKLEREIAELRSLVESKSSREEELEREIEMLRRGSIPQVGAGHRSSAVTIGTNERNSIRDSRGTVVLAPPRSPEAPHKNSLRHSRPQALEPMPESDTYSTATENSTLWCEICETAGHDILTCTNMFGSEQQQQQQQQQKKQKQQEQRESEDADVSNNIESVTRDMDKLAVHDDIKPAPLSPVKAQAAPPPVAETPTPTVRTIPNPMESGPVAGKESGVVDNSKWCALCERDGHDSVDCPFEDAF